MHNTENKKVKMKFKLNCVDKKNIINLNIRKNDLNSRNSSGNDSGIGSSIIAPGGAPSNAPSSGAAVRSSVEKPGSKSVTKNIKINIASSGVNKIGLNANPLNNSNGSNYAKRENCGISSPAGMSVHDIKNGNNANGTTGISSVGCVGSVGSVGSVGDVGGVGGVGSAQSGGNVNIVSIANSTSAATNDGTGYSFKTKYNEGKSRSNGISQNDNTNLHGSLSKGDNLNANDNVSSNDNPNISGHTKDNSNNNNSSVNNFLHGNNKYIIKNNLKIYYKNELIPHSFLYHKILTILKSHYNNHINNNPSVANKGISFFHIENMLINFGFKGVDINNHLLLSYLAASKQIKIDLKEKRICYLNPYVDITNVTSLLNKINKHGFLYGYEISDDLINTNKEVYKWVNTLLYEKKVRCIRSNNSHLRGKLKCKNLPTFCDIYAKNKCDNCFYNLKGYIFFPLSYQHIEKERYSITNDIKNLWDEITLPNLDNILKEYKLKSTNKVFVNDNIPKRKNKDEKLTPIIKKMKRIYNTHLFTADEIKNEFIQKK
ncbi:conserved Plasmodium protein, unknown function [Plasmodium ovale wallikeri]|uniref:Uncharacterized protein n=1 Tax=Plasmodium ovale wallikeri TaxID=864142 RepID=A0A1A8ZBC2_PLAOA|nr:conserved Plasmodium protein, unknown function [Plasmodium ovale wallikeri]